MFVANSEEELRKVFREEARALARELVTVVAQPTPVSTDPDAILSYETAGKLVDRDAETIRAWTVQKKLRRYRHGGAVGVKRAELLALFERRAAPGSDEPVSPESKADAILNKRRGKR